MINYSLVPQCEGFYEFCLQLSTVPTRDFVKHNSQCNQDGFVLVSTSFAPVAVLKISRLY